MEDRNNNAMEMRQVFLLYVHFHAFLMTVLIYLWFNLLFSTSILHVIRKCNKNVIAVGWTFLIFKGVCFRIYFYYQAVSGQTIPSNLTPYSRPTLTLRSLLQLAFLSTWIYFIWASHVGIFCYGLSNSFYCSSILHFFLEYVLLCLT